MTLASLFALGCTGSDGTGEGTPPTTTEGGFTERGVYHYVLDPGEAGQPVFGGAHEIVVPEERGKAEAIDQPNKPSRLHPELREHTTYDAEATSGETDWKVGASQWWPQSKNGIAQRWAPDADDDLNEHGDIDNLSPVEKYDFLFYPGQSQTVPAVEHWSAADMRKPEDERGDKISHPEVTVIGPATKWELQNHGVYQHRSEPDSWWGHCNGWASYVTTEPNGFPDRDIRVKLVNGEITECTGSLENAEGCVLVRMGDTEALITELYFSDKSTFAGRRCNTDPDEMERDDYGRPKEKACRDLNPGSFHIGVVGLLAKGAKHFATNEDAKPAFVIDHNFDWEVWNFPLSKFQVDEQTELTAEQANQELGATGSDYQFNSNAVKFIKIKMRYWMISDGVNMTKMLQHVDERGVSPHENELRYILELDADDKILGGEWLKVPTYSWSSEEKEIHPDFYWMGVGHKGWGEDADDLGGNDDNPYVAYSKVKALLECANDPASCAPDEKPPEVEDGPCVDHCGSSSEENGAQCWCDDQCSKYGDCCSDYEEACVGEAPSGPSCEGHCGSSDPVTENNVSCYCDSSCTGYGDCCEDYATVCGSD